MDRWIVVRDFLIRNPLAGWLIAMLAVGTVVIVFQGYFEARKIQPGSFRWRRFRNEILLGALALSIGGGLQGLLTVALTNHGFIKFNTSPTGWWVIALEYLVYFVAYDTYFYWNHRFFHLRAIYPWLHKLHHYSTAPNLVTTVSLHPLESFIEGAFIPVFAALFPLHAVTMLLIGPTNILMGLYVHSGYEFLPRWWNKSWATKWFITATFHDQHHKYFNHNYGGFTTVWDRICGTVRPKYEADFDALKARLNGPLRHREAHR
jgi:sterol desaturase/sphingolipid hydroxylase (fatty acid hydroxylase superfamily)